MEKLWSASTTWAADQALDKLIPQRPGNRIANSLQRGLRITNLSKRGMAFAILLSCLVLAGCGGDIKSASHGTSESASTGGSSPPTTGGPNPPSSGPTIASAKSAPSVVGELATTQSVKLTLTSKGYTGAVDIKIDSPELDAVDVKDGVNITVNPSTVNFTNGSTVQVDVTVDILSKAPSVFNEHFHILFAKAGTQVVMSEDEVGLTIMPIFRIKVMGVGDANWLVNGKAINTLFNSTVVNRGIDFVHHDAGLKVILENYSTVPVRIHSSGPIPHQGNTPMSASADGVTMGGTYAPNAVIGNALSTSGLYIHDAENANAARRMVFNSNL